MNIKHPSAPGTSQPSNDDGLYLAVRAAFVTQGNSLNRWCIANGVSRPYATEVLRGFWNGSIAKALRKKIVTAAGIER